MRPLYPLLRNYWFGWLHTVKAVKEQPALKVIFIGCFSVAWLTGLSALFYSGFDFMQKLGGIGSWLIPQLFTLFFMGLGFMLVLSGAVTGYANLYQGADTKRLLAWPVPLRDLLYFKFVQTATMSSWAFFFVIAPFIGAYAVLEFWPWYVTIGTLLFSVPFVLLLSGMGMALMFPFVRFAPKGKILGLIGFVTATAVLLWVGGVVEQIQGEQPDDLLSLTDILPGMALARHPMTVNYWMAEGILALAKGDWMRSGFFFVLLSSSVVVLAQVSLLLGRWFFMDGYQRQLIIRTDRATTDSVLSRIVRALAPGRARFKGFAWKDSLIFLRDPSQWAQFVIFFGLLGLYFMNLRSLGYGDISAQWGNLIAFLNMFSLSAVMSSLASRFVFPQLSMEGRVLWVVGIAPTTMSRIMATKFVVAFMGLLVVGMGLANLSNAMLEIPTSSLWISMVLMPCVAFALAGMSTGLGGVFMEISAKTATQMLSGYGGTLNLILTLIVTIILVLVPGIISHMLVIGTIPAEREAIAVAGACLYMLLVSGISGGVPLWLGHRALSNRDY